MAVMSRLDIEIGANSARFTQEMSNVRNTSRQTAAQIQRDAENQAKQRVQIERQYANEHQRIEMDLANELRRIRSAGFDPAEQQRYLSQARANAQAQVNSIAEQERVTKGYADKAKLAYGFVATAVVGATVAVGALIKEQMELAAELSKTAQIANTSVTAIQKYTFAAKASGIEMDKLGDVFKDTQDKVGDFLSTGGGELEDFFKNVAPQAGLTAEKIRTLSGPDALQAMYNAMEQANLSQSEMIFYMEGIADEASLLIPLLANGGEGFRLWEDAARNAGAIMDEKTTRSMQELNTATKLFDLSIQGAKNQIATQFAPVLSDLAGLLVKDATLKGIATSAGQGLATGFKYIIATGLGVVGIFRLIGNGLGTFAYAVRHPTEAIETIAQGYQNMGSIITEVNKAMDATFSLGARQGNPTVTALTNINIQQDKIRAGLGKTGAAIQAEQKAAEDAAKAHDKLAKAKEKSAKASSMLPTATANAIAWGANKLGIDPNYLASVISFETGGTFSTNARNPGSSGTGLVQIMQYADGTDHGGNSAKWDYYGMSRNQFGALSVAEQMQYVVKYFQVKGLKPGSNLGQVYDAVTGTGYRDIPKYGKNGKRVDAYWMNRVWDTNKDGYIAPGESVKSGAFKAHMKNFFAGGSNPLALGEVDNQMAGIAEKQANVRLQIERETADKVTQINLDLQGKLDKLKQAGFSDEKQKQLEQYYKDDANAQIAQYEQAQAKKLSSFSEFKKSEFDKITEEMTASINAVKYDETLTESQKKLAYKDIEEQALLKANMARLNHDKEKQQANAIHQTNIENITAEAQLQRREIELNTTLSRDLRQAKLDAINQQEQETLRQAHLNFENELSGITDYSKTELQRLRAEYADERSKLDARTDIDDTQKSDLRNALAGKEIYFANQIKKPAADSFNSLNAEMSGTSDFLSLQAQQESRLKVIQDALNAEVIATEQAEKAKTAIERQGYIDRYTLAVDKGGQIFGSISAVLKSTLGEHNKFYIATMAIEKSASIFRGIMAVKTGIALATANPFPMNLGAIATVAAAGAGIISDLMSLRQPAIVGQAHNGIRRVPNSGTWNLLKGEEVVAEDTSLYLHKTLNKLNANSSHLERKYSDFSQDKADKTKNAVNVNIINNAGVSVQQTQDSNGDLRVIIGEELAKQLPRHVNDEYSEFNQNLKRKYHIQRKFN